MTIECFDILWTAAGESHDFELYYTSGTSFGNESNPAAWLRRKTRSVTG